MKRAIWPNEMYGAWIEANKKYFSNHKNLSIMTTTLSNFNTFIKSVYGGQEMAVDCIATINGEQYRIIYVRNPITGELQKVICEGPVNDYTTENTLINKAVEDAVWDELQS